jgi:pimeloyl-ACP methyl ester carboxylesterase
MLVFYGRHLCRLDPWPEEVTRTFAALEEDPTVYGTMNGPSEFHVVGSRRGWDLTDRLGEIQVPTLLLSGAHDEATPRIVGAGDREGPRALGSGSVSTVSSRASIKRVDGVAEACGGVGVHLRWRR